MTGLGNEPGDQPVGGDDGWMSHQVYSGDTHILKHAHTYTENRMQQREHTGEVCQESSICSCNTEWPPCLELQEEHEVREGTGLKIILQPRTDLHKKAAVV